MGTIKTNTTKNQMKFFNVAASLGALCAVSEAIRIRSVEQNTEETNQGLGHLRTADSNLVQRASPERKELVGQRIERGAQMSLSALAAGASNWWGWYVSAAVDAAQDLALDVVQDVNGWIEDVKDNVTKWITQAAEGSIDGVDDVAGDIIGWVEDIVNDVGDIQDGTY